MLFRKKIDRSCAYCTRCTRYSSDQMLCTKRGIVSNTYACWRFKYDPFKRVPLKPKPMDFSKYDEDDFSL